MQETYVEQIRKIIQNKRELEKELEVKITNRGKNVFVDGPAEKEYLAIKFLEAIDVGFSIEKALILKEENMMLHILNIRDITKRNDLKRIRARIIGTKGKTLSTLHSLTDCEISLHEKNIGIIGNSENIENAIQAFKSLILGSKQGNVYARLEKEKKKKRLNISDLNIKKEL